MVGLLNAQRARSLALTVCLTVAILRPAYEAPGQATTQPTCVPVAAVAATLAATVLAGSFSGDYGGLLPRPRKRRDDLHIPNLGACRTKQARNLSSIARKACELDKVLKAGFSQPTSVQHLQRDVRDVNIVLLCLMFDALNHPDVNLPRNFLQGFPVTGVVPDSGVLRPIPTAGSEEAFWTGYKRTMATNNSWATTLASAVNSEGLSAHGRRRELLRRSWDLTKKEVSQGFASQPMTLAQLKAKYKLVDGNLGCRPLQRHGIVQGQKQARDDQGLPVFEPGGAPKMVDKIRLIDDSKASLHNSTLIRCCETIAPCRFTYMGFVADETLRQASSLDVHAPELVFSLDDMKSAYRQIPTTDPEMCIICIYSFDKGNLGPRFVEQHGHKYAPAPHAGERLARKPALHFPSVHATLACTLRGTDTLDPSAASGIPQVSLTTTGSLY
jgi:hypothetical protein